MAKATQKKTKRDKSEQEFLDRVFAYILSRGAAKISIKFSGGGDEGGFDEGEWLDKKNKHLADFHVYGDRGKLGETPGEGAPEGWEKTYNDAFNTELRVWLEVRMYSEYSFNDEPFVDGVLVINAIRKTATLRGSESYQKAHPFKTEW